jgi:hypothetical protein
MGRSVNDVVVFIAVAAAAIAVPPARAQGGMPMGSTTVARPADSVFSQFLYSLKAQGDSTTSIDRGRRAIEARVRGAEEPVIFRFISRGDSTTITAQGTRGGMAALIMGLSVVHDWLKSGPASKPDSS